MNCDDCQLWISESLDGALDASANSVAARHEAECPTCRGFRTSMQSLDRQLTSQVPTESLPTDFKASLLARLPAPNVRLTPFEVAERRAELEHEYQTARVFLNGRYLVPQARKLVELLAVAATCAVAGFVVASLVRTLPVVVETTARELTVTWTLQLLGCGLAFAVLLRGARRNWGLAFAGLPSWSLLRSK